MLEEGILEEKKRAAHIPYSSNITTLGVPVVKAIKSHPSILNHTRHGDGQGTDPTETTNKEISEGNRFFKEDHRNTDIEESLKRFKDEILQINLKLRATKLAKSNFSKSKKNKDLENSSLEESNNECIDIDEYLDNISEGSKKDKDPGVKAIVKKKLRAERNVVKYDKNNEVKAGKNWDKEKQLSKALEICELDEVDGITKFIEVLRETGYVASKGFFYAKKIVTLYRFLTTITEISEYKLSKKVGFIFPSDKYLEKSTDLSRRTLSRYLLDLEKMGLIERDTLFNYSNDCSFHSFRKIYITPKEEILEKNEEYEPSKPKFVDKKYFLNKKERFYIFKSLFFKYKTRHIKQHKYDPGENNPYLYEYTRPFGSPKSDIEIIRSNHYPVLGIGTKVKWLWYQKY